jgi:RimJ/RimL family protein N-acetyltransferase
MNAMSSIFPPGLPLVHGRGLTDEMAAWAAKRIPHVGEDGFGSCWAVGIAHKGALQAVVVFHDWQIDEGTVQASCAADSWRGCSRELLGEILAPAFEGRLGVAPVRKVWVSAPSTNDAALRFIERTGFKREAVLREQYGPRVHAVVFGMMRREWRKRYRSG